MRILGIETSGPVGSVAVLCDGRVEAEFEHREPNSHAERVLSLVELALAEAKLTKADIDRVGVGTGPGSFTGLRVGIALAQGIGLGLNRPVVGVPSLLALARAGSASGVSGLVVPVLDARREEVFTAAYAADGTERLAPTAVSASELVKLLASWGTATTLLGAGASLLGDAFPRLEGPSFEGPHARWVAQLAGELDPERHPPVPIYVRDAELRFPTCRPRPWHPNGVSRRSGASPSITEQTSVSMD